jgi:hypothetical protein
MIVDGLGQPDNVHGTIYLITATGSHAVPHESSARPSVGIPALYGVSTLGAPVQIDESSGASQQDLCLIGASATLTMAEKLITTIWRVPRIIFRVCEQW